MDPEKAIIGYFIWKNVDNLGHLKYGYYKRIIGYVLDYHHDYFIRKIFLSLVDKGYFTKTKNIKKSYSYKFNKNPAIKPVEPEVIDPKRFTISFD